MRNTRAKRRRIAVFALIVAAGTFLAGGVINADETPADSLADAVFERIAERLETMVSVAAWKRAHGVAVEDRAREELVLNVATEKAVRAGLAAVSARAFFQVQIDAAKEIQSCWMRRWDADGSAPPAPPDLRSDIRPRLVALGDALLVDVKEALAGGVRFGDSRYVRFSAVVDVVCLVPETRQQIYRSLGRVRPVGGAK